MGWFFLFLITVTVCFSATCAIFFFLMSKIRDEIQDQISDGKPAKKPVIPLHKTYIWGIIICIVLLISIILFNALRAPSVTPIPKDDYLALLRNAYENAIESKGNLSIGNESFPDIENRVSEQTGHTIVFPDWIPLISAEILGVKISDIGSDQVVNLLFKIEDHTIDFITIFNTKDEIKDLESVTIENQVFYKYKWGINNAYFWELDEDKDSITYGVISDMSDTDLEMVATDAMRSLKTHYSQGQTESTAPKVP
jgi:hypothetical protein